MSLRPAPFWPLTVALTTAFCFHAASAAVLPDGRTVTPVGFTVRVEGFASSFAMSPDHKWLAVLSQDGGAIDVLAVGEDAALVERLPVPWASGMTWTRDGLYVTRGYSGAISRFSYDAARSANGPVFTKLPDVHVGGLLNGIAEDPALHRIAVARTAAREVVVLDDRTGATLRRLRTSGEPFSVALAGGLVIATMYNGDYVDAWRGSASPVSIRTGPHPTALLVDGGSAYVANAAGHDVAQIDLSTLAVSRRLDLAIGPDPLSGQVPSGMALSTNRRALYVAESGFNDVAVVDLASGKVAARIPTAWYPMGVIYEYKPSYDDDPRNKQHLWVLSAQGLGAQSDPGGEWDGLYTGSVQHLLIEPSRFAEWSADVAKNNQSAVALAPVQLPPIKHVVFIVRENKHFDEEFGDESQANADPNLLLYGRAITPNAHALAERYALFDNFMGNGQASIYGHSWATQGMTDDYQERNAHTPDDPATSADARVPYSIWPYAMAGEDTLTRVQMDFDWFKNLADLPHGPRTNVSAIFGPRGELIDALHRKGVSFRVYGEQMTMLADGRIAPGLAAHAARNYPGAHIDFGVLDTQRAKLFLDDVAAHGLAAYTYLTLPTDHTAGFKPGFYSPASYVSNNDLALGRIIEGLSKLPDWSSTVVFVSPDDPQGSGDHVDSHRMPVFAVGPYIRRGFVDHTRYSIPSIFRTVETLYGIDPLNMYDAQATPLTAAFADQPDAQPYTALPENIPMRRNPGKVTMLSMDVDGPESGVIPAQEWMSIKGTQSLALHEQYLRSIAHDNATIVAEIENLIWYGRL